MFLPKQSPPIKRNRFIRLSSMSVYASRNYFDNCMSYENKLDGNGWKCVKREGCHNEEVQAILPELRNTETCNENIRTK